MAERTLSDELKVTRVINAVAAGTDDTTDGTILDMQGFRGVVFIADFGTIATGAVTDIRARGGDLANGSDMADLVSTKVSITDAQDNKVLVLDVSEPAYRYIRVRVTRRTANATVDGVVALQYAPSKMPTTNAASVAAAEIHVSPAQGSASA